MMPLTHASIDHKFNAAGSGSIIQLFSVFTVRRTAVMLLLASTWFIQVAVFVDIFVGRWISSPFGSSPVMAGGRR